MPSSRRCVFGCVTKGITGHSFPNPAKFPERFKTWVELAGEQLKNLSVEEIARKKVCDKHFIDSHRNRNNRLNALAIPTLHLPRASAEVTNTDFESVNIELPSNSQHLLSGASAEVANTELESVNIELPFTSQHILSGPSAEVTNTELESVNIELPSTSQHLLSGASAEVTNTELESVNIELPSTSQHILSDAETHDHDYCAGSIGNPSTTKKVRRKSSMTTKTRDSKTKTNLSYFKEAERKTRKLRREIPRLRKRCKSFKSRLEAAIKLSDSKAFQRVTAIMTLPATDLL